MTRSRRWLAASAASLLLLVPAAASAVIPTGSFAIDLGGGQSVWLGTGASEQEFCEGFEQGFGGALDACSLSLFVDAKGKISGSAEVAARSGALFVGLSGPAKGKLKGDKRSVGAAFSFSLKLSGQGGDGGGTAALSANVRFEGRIDSAGILNGSWSFKLCSKASGCLADADAQGPDALGDGDWTLLLEVTDAGGGRLGGNATAMLGDGTLCQYSISGKYDAKKDLASLKLSPRGSPCDGTSIQLKRVRGAPLLSAEIKYKLFGARGDTVVELVP